MVPGAGVERGRRVRHLGAIMQVIQRELVLRKEKVVPGAGLEPAPLESDEILSLACLPISPPGLRYMLQSRVVYRSGSRLSITRVLKQTRSGFEGVALAAMMGNNAIEPQAQRPLESIKQVAVFGTIALLQSG